MALGTWHLTLGTWNLAFTTWHLALGIWYTALGTLTAWHLALKASAHHFVNLTYMRNMTTGHVNHHVFFFLYIYIYIYESSQVASKSI